MRSAVSRRVRLDRYSSSAAGRYASIQDHFLLVLHHGELLAEGSPDDIRSNAEVKRVYLGQN